MKTVAHLLPNYNPFPPVYPAGTELRVEQVSRRQRRYRPVVVCGCFPGQLEAETLGAMHVRRIRIGPVYRRLFQKLTRLDPVPYTDRMWRVVQAEDSLLVHIHNEPKLLSGLEPHLAAGGRPVVVHVANEKPIDPLSIPRVASWLAASRYIAGWLEQKNGISPDKIKVVYTGVDVSAHVPWWRIGAAERSALRVRFGVRRASARVILFAGRIVREKGVLELLDAFELLRDRYGEGVELLIAGNVRESDDPGNEKAVYGKAAMLRIKGISGVRYVGSLHPAEMHDFLLAGDVFALSSLWDDPFPTVMLEAAAAGLPIVAAARGGVTEFLQGCEAFDFVPRPEDPQQLATALERYIDSSADAERAGRWLRRKIEAQFDWQRVADEFESVYDQVLGEGTP